LLPTASFVETTGSPSSGFVAEIHARRIGEAVVALGGGRAKKGDAIDHSVGIEVLRNVGDYVEEGESLFTIHAGNQSDLAEARARTLEAHTFSRDAVGPLPLFYGVVNG
jgi:thymidine phosphorylase